MAKRVERNSALLPLSEPLLAHHGKTLFGLMGEWIHAARIPPVLLITGVKGSGKRDIAHFLAQWVLCEQNPLSRAASPDLFGGGLFSEPAPASSATQAEPRPCGSCGACQRALSGSWVDFHEILPDEDTGALKIESFRKLKTSLGFGSHEGSYRITLISGADRMTPQAANSVLKLLEEPPPGWLFFLTAGDSSLVLPTILSRCQSLRLRPLDPETVEKLLEKEGIPADRLRICAELGQGSLGRAISFADDEIWAQRKTLFSFLLEPQTHLNALQDWVGTDSSRLELFLDQMENVVADLVRCSISPQAHAPENYSWTNRDGSASLARHLRAVIRSKGDVPVAREFWVKAAARLAAARAESLTPVNRKLLLQDLLLPWLEALRK